MWPRHGEHRQSRRARQGGAEILDGEIVDSDVDLHDPAQVAETGLRQWDILIAIGVGGILGAEGRYGLGEMVPHSASQFPWSTLIVNASGCLLIGALMVMILELTSPHRLVRPFLGVGILGGYTTFSTFTVDAERLVMDHQPLLALSYVAATLAACLAAVTAATIATQLIGRAVLDSGVRHRESGKPR